MEEIYRVQEGEFDQNISREKNKSLLPKVQRIQEEEPEQSAYCKAAASGSSDTSCPEGRRKTRHEDSRPYGGATADEKHGDISSARVDDALADEGAEAPNPYI